MSAFLTYLVSGIALGCVFALIGSGFVVIHRVTRVVNFAQGTLAVFGGMLSYSLLGAKLPHGVAEVLAVIATGVIGLAFGFISLGRRGTPATTSLLVTVGLSVFSSAVFILFWGQNPVSPTGVPGKTELFGAAIQNQRLLIVAATVVVFAATMLFFGRSYYGKGLTAAASNPLAARIVGINVRAMGLVAFGIAGVLGGIAGVLISPVQPVSFSSDLPLALNGFAAAVFGGVSSPALTLLGGLLLGAVAQLAAGYLGGSYQTEVALVMMLIVMIARRRALRGEEAK
jgi:branched-chain amino acid transport system permease protein